MENAARLLRGLGYVRYAGAEGRDLRLESTPEGAAWLALPDRERLAALLGIPRRSSQRNPSGPYSADVLPFFPLRLNFDLAKGAGLDSRAALARALLALPGGFVPVAAFLEHVGRAANPYVEALRAGKKLREAYWGQRPPLRREWEELWSEVVGGFLSYRLVALGGARLGRTAGGEACFRLTEAGRYLLGAAETFEYGHAAEGEVVVQPNFEVVFLARAPRLEAMLARVAERVGPGPGVTFRLTRASVLAAAEAGMGRDQVLEALRSASSRALPANVERQVGDWLAAVRRVKLRPATLVECPDRETAARVQSAAGKQVRVLAPKVLELSAPTGAERTALVRKLRAAGIFVE